MKKYVKLIILSVVLLALIGLITLAMIFDIDVVLFKNLSIAGIQEKKLDVEDLIEKQSVEEANNSKAKEELQKSKNAFDVAKENYENIDPSTIELVREATKEENYFIEYLWIVLGNYATSNKVSINITTPGATNESTNSNTNAAALKNVVTITVEGRYANIADFVFDVENDKSLRFKLDNIQMIYSGNNKVKATFDVLSLSVLK